MSGDKTWKAVQKRLNDAEERGYNKEKDLKDRIAEAQEKDFLCLDDTHLIDADLDGILEKLAECHHLTEISCSNNPITDDGLRKIIGYCKAHPNIKKLMLNTLPMITDSGAKELLLLENLEELHLWKCREISDEFANAVLGIEQPHLANIDLRETCVSHQKRLTVSAHLRKNKPEQEEGVEKFDALPLQRKACVIL